MYVIDTKESSSSVLAMIWAQMMNRESIQEMEDSVWIVWYTQFLLS